ncbi:MAG: GNAT family N-acetyltransferase [Candidatus Melainabacteria bacterium HGW-Melainabacteria-1]|nr:MAG: GNAT family N-acetyltransferase [Candidatus Melainabacteria bacterium HGW-Melainabacteria-1]
MQIDILPATPDQQPILANLLELYSHDFSEFVDVKLGADGRFGYQQLPLYWREAHRHPFLIQADGELAGLVLLQQGSQITGAPEIWDVAEFFVLRSYRRHGVGRQAAHAVWRRFTGDWEVRVTARNTGALHFWQRAISAFTGQLAQAELKQSASKSQYLFSFRSQG